MEHTVTHELGTKVIDGKNYMVVKHQIICEEPRDIFKEVHKEFTYDEKKQAKLNHKSNL